MDSWELTWSRSVRPSTAQYAIIVTYDGFAELAAFADSAEMARQLVRLLKLQYVVEARRHEKAISGVCYNDLSISAAVYNPRGFKFSARRIKEKHRRLVPLTFNHHDLPLYFGKRAFLRRLVRLMDKRKVPRLYLACIAHNFTGHEYWGQHVNKVKRIADGGDFNTIWPAS